MSDREVVPVRCPMCPHVAPLQVGTRITRDGRGQAVLAVELRLVEQCPDHKEFPDPRGFWGW